MLMCRLHQQCHAGVERLFSTLKSRFLSLHNENRMALYHVPDAIVCSCILHNIAIRRGILPQEEIERFRVEDFGIDDVQNDNNGQHGDFTMRNHIIEQMFR